MRLRRHSIVRDVLCFLLDEVQGSANYGRLELRAGSGRCTHAQLPRSICAAAIFRPNWQRLEQKNIVFIRTNHFPIGIHFPL